MVVQQLGGGSSAPSRGEIEHFGKHPGGLVHWWLLLNPHQRRWRLFLRCLGCLEALEPKLIAADLLGYVLVVIVLSGREAEDAVVVEVLGHRLISAGSGDALN